MIQKLFIATIVAFTMFSCDSKKNADHKLITPLPAGITVDNLQDCTVPATFSPNDFNWTGEILSMTVYNQDLYDVVDISQMQVGDTIIYSGEPMIINKLEKNGGDININGGLDEGGCCLAPYGGGTYVARDWDDHATYTKLGKAELALAKDFVIIDCGLFPQDPSDTINTNQKLYIENLKPGHQDFHPLNTRVKIENGKITEINRHWIP